MTSAAEFQAKVTKAETNMTRWDDIVNGGPLSVVETDNGPVPSYAKFIADSGFTADAAERAEAALASSELIAASVTGMWRSGSISEREAIPIGDRKRGLRFLATDIDPWRVFEWRGIGDASGAKSDGPALTVASWVGLYTAAEEKNLGIGFTGSLPFANVAGLTEGYAATDSLAAIKIADFRALALSTDTNPKVELTWGISGVQPASQLVSWGGFSVPLSGGARSFTPKDWAAVKQQFFVGNSLTDPTGRTDGWAQLYSTALGVGAVYTAKWSSDARQVYRAGVTPLYLTLQGNTLPAGGTARSISAINGSAPNADATVSPQSWLNEAPGATGTGNVSQAGTIVDGAVTRHGIASIPNGGSTAYTFTQDAGGAALTLSGPVLFIPDVAQELARSDLNIWIGNNYFFSSLPNSYGDYTNPQMWVDMAAIIAKAVGNRVLILPVLPSADFVDRGVGTAYNAYLAANARTKALYPTLWALDTAGRDLIQRLQASGDGSANDNADIANGFIPRSLRADALHLNTAGYAIVSAFMIEARARQTLPPVITQSTIFTLSATGFNPRTGASLGTISTVANVSQPPLEYAQALSPTFQLANIGGTANAITADMPAPMTAYANGQQFYFVAAAANTAPSPTLKIGPLAAMPIVDEVGGALQAGDLEAGKLYYIRVSTSSSTFRITASHSSKRRVLADANLTGTPRAATQAYTDGSDKIATTGMVQAAKQISTYTLPNVAGTPNAITADVPSGSGVAGYASGQIFIFFAASSNTASAPTINIAGLGAIPLIDGNGVALNAGDIVGGYPYTIRISAASPFAARVISAGYPVAVAKVDAKRALSYSPNLVLDPEFTLLAAGQTQSWTGGLMTAEKRKGALALRTPAGGTAVALSAPFTVAVEDLPSGLLSVSVVIREKESTVADANFRFRIEAENSAGSPIVANGTWPTTGNGDGAGQRWEKNVPFAAITAPTPFVIADSVPIALPVAAGAVRFRLVIREQTTGKVWISHINMRDGIDTTYEPPRAAAASTPSTLAVLKSTTSLPNGAQGQNTAGGGFTCTGLDRIGPTGKFAGCWIVGNDGRIGPDTITTGPETVNNCSIVILSPDFTRIVREFNIKGNTTDFPSAGSIQGVAWDSSDDTIWFAEQNSKQIYHIDMTGAKIADTINPSAFFNTPANLPNGIAYDSVNDALWVGEYTTARAYRIACAAGHAVQVTLATALAADHDQMGYDETTGYLYYSKGANGFNAEVYVVASATGAAVRSWTGLELSQAVEGVFIDFTKKRMFLVNDGGFHAAAQPPLALANMYEFGA